MVGALRCVRVFETAWTSFKQVRSTPLTERDHLQLLMVCLQQLTLGFISPNLNQNKSSRNQTMPGKLYSQQTIRAPVRVSQLACSGLTTQRPIDDVREQKGGRMREKRSEPSQCSLC